MKQIERVIANQYEFKNIKFRYAELTNFTFHYTSPGGRSSLTTKLNVSNDSMYNKLNKLNLPKEHSKRERSKMTAKLREQIKVRDNYTCQICGTSTHEEPNLLLEIDHIIPVSKGGTSAHYNLQTLCWRCNRTKSNN